MKPGYYIDHCGDIAIRYPNGSWDILYYYSEEFSLESNENGSRDRTATLCEWEWMGDL